MKKIRTISSKSELNSVLSRDGGACDVTKGILHSPRYHLLSVDLRGLQAVLRCIILSLYALYFVSSCVVCRLLNRRFSTNLPVSVTGI